MIQNITAITLASPNMSRAIRFYRMLGFEIAYLNLIAHLPSEIGLGGDVLSSTIPTLTPSMRLVAAGYRPDISRLNHLCRGSAITSWPCQACPPIPLHLAVAHALR
jgi:hypothetical protein